MIDYKRLSAVLKKAADAAIPYGDSEDGGTCNFDSLMLSLPRYNHDKTILAINDAGLRGYITHSRLFGTVYLVTSPIGRQGNSNTRQAEAMRDSMKADGYEASVWYQMD